MAYFLVFFFLKTYFYNRILVVNFGYLLFLKFHYVLGLLNIVGYYYYYYF